MSVKLPVCIQRYSLLNMSQNIRKQINAPFSKISRSKCVYYEQYGIQMAHLSFVFSSSYVQQYKPEGLNTGDIVAAPFQGDDLWYRARILGFLEDNKVDLYYVDYGDCGHVPRSDVFTLR